MKTIYIGLKESFLRWASGVLSHLTGDRASLLAVVVHLSGFSFVHPGCMVPPALALDPYNPRTTTLKLDFPENSAPNPASPMAITWELGDLDP